MNGGAVWLVAGLLLGAQELLAPGVFLLWIGLAAIGTGLLTTVFAFDWHWQIVGFTGLAIVLVAVASHRRPAPDVVNAPQAGLIGTTCYALAFAAGEGRVRLRDGTWQARLDEGAAPAESEPLRVVGLDGTTLLVARISPPAPAAASSTRAAPPS